MEWLGNWLKQVILIILLAAFVDLLLPNQAMQRYVKTVVSLFLLLTLLTPVFELFQRGWDADKLIADAERLQEGSRQVAGSGLSGGGSKLQTLDMILAESEKVKADNRSEARKLAETRLAEEMKAGLEKATGSEVDSLEAHIEPDSKGNPVIGSVRATLLHKTISAAAPSAAAPSADGQTARPGQVRVEEVKPVAITIEPLDRNKAGASRETGAVEGSPQASEQYLQAVRFFRQEWQVEADRLELAIIPPK